MAFFLSHESPRCVFFELFDQIVCKLCFPWQAMSEGETLRWMNEGLKVMWPISMEKFASQHFFKPMAPWFLNRFKPKFVVRFRVALLFCRAMIS